MNKHTLLIIGAGGHGRSVAEAALRGNLYEVIGFLDDGLAGGKVWDLPVLGTTDELSGCRSLASHGVAAIGNNAVREALSDRLVKCGFSLATVVHPEAIISPSAIIESGCAIMAGAIVGTEAHIGRGAIVNCGAVVDHDARVHDFGHLGVGACMAGGSILGYGAWIQAGCTLGYGVEIEAGVVLTPGTALP